eukprot:1177720-Pyramimonas_sp.AAC.1
MDPKSVLACYVALQNSAEQYKTRPSNAKQCNALQSNANQWKAMTSNAKTCKAMQRDAKQIKAIPRHTM